MDARNCGLCAACGVGDYDRCLELKAQPAQSVPDGWQLVPVEPTQKMKAAGQATIDKLANDGIERYWQDIYGSGYKSMLAAAPKLAQQPENRKCVFCKWSGTSEYLTVTPEGEFLCPKCHDRTVQQPEQGAK